jgi:prepilin peptidase CpaA
LLSAALIWPGALSLLLVWGAASDIRSRILPNWLAVVLLAFGLVSAWLNGGIEALGWHAAHSAIALIAGMGLFAAGLFGGGDAKFYAGLAAYFPVSMGLKLLLFVAIAGGALAIIWLVARKIAAERMASAKGNFTKLPYGVAIAAGGIALAWA